MNQELIHSLAGRLKAQSLSVATAESLTGGQVAAALTALPGSSVYFQGAVVAYSNQLKVELLGVPMEVLMQYGAVSEACALAMVEGVRRKLNVSAAVATTGIAGPDGGSLEKPVGLVWLAAAVGKKVLTRQRFFEGDRGEVTNSSVREALVLLSEAI